MNAGTTFNGAIGSLAKLSKDIGNTGLVATEQESRLKRLFTSGLNKFQEFDPNQVQKKQEIMITVTADQNGIITPVVESKQLEIKVTNIAKQTVTSQARKNDR